MAFISTHDPWVLGFGILGNIISFIVFLAPVPTFVRICKKKSTEGYQSIPYLVTVFSAMLWIYYAMVKTNAFLLITINAFGCVVETVYVGLYIVYATKQARAFTVRTFALLDFGGACLVFIVIQFLTKEAYRVHVLGWICVAFSISVFAAPLSIMRLVIRTKSVEFMPFHLSLFLFLSAITWLMYGIFLKDLCVMIPNVLGLVFGILQMGLYAAYKNHKPLVIEDAVKVPDDAVKVLEQSVVDIPKLDNTVEDLTGVESGCEKKEDRDTKTELIIQIKPNQTECRMLVPEYYLDLEGRVPPKHSTIALGA